MFMSFLRGRQLTTPDARPIHTDAGGAVAVCALLDRQGWKSCLWTLVSFYGFAQCKHPLVVYDDGPLSTSSHKAILRLFPNASIIDRRCADLVIPRALADYPNCVRLRQTAQWARRIIDLPLLCGAKRILMLDDDVLFFKYPEKLLVRLASGEAGEFVSGRAMDNPCAHSPDQVFERFGVHINEWVSRGVMLADVSEFPYGPLDHWLDGLERDSRSWGEQALWTMYADNNRSAFVGRENDVKASPDLELESVSKRYLARDRGTSYGEGAMRVREELLSRGVFER